MRIKDPVKLKRYCQIKYSDKLVNGNYQEKDPKRIWEVGEYLPEWQHRYNFLLETIKHAERVKVLGQEYPAGITLDEWRELQIHEIISEIK